MINAAGKTLTRTVTINMLDTNSERECADRQCGRGTQTHGYADVATRPSVGTDADGLTWTHGHADTWTWTRIQTRTWTHGHSDATSPIANQCCCCDSRWTPSSAYGVIVSGMVYHTVLLELAQAEATQYNRSSPKL